MTTGVVVTTVLVIVAGLLFFKKNAPVQPIHERTSVYKKDEAESFVKQLDDLGYFKYADKADTGSLKANFIKEFDPQGELSSVWDDKLICQKIFDIISAMEKLFMSKVGLLNYLKT